MWSFFEQLMEYKKNRPFTCTLKWQNNRFSVCDSAVGQFGLGSFTYFWSGWLEVGWWGGLSWDGLSLHSFSSSSRLSWACSPGGCMVPRTKYRKLPCFYWEIINICHYVSLRCTAWWIDLYIYNIYINDYHNRFS